MNGETSHFTSRAEFLESLIDAIPIPVFYKDACGAYRDCNKAFASMIVGLPRREIIGKTLFDFPGQIPRERAEIYFQKDKELFAAGRTQVYVEIVRCADGQNRTFQFYKSAHRNSAGVIEGIVGVMLDISETVIAREHLLRQKEELDLLLSSIASIISLRRS